MTVYDHWTVYRKNNGEEGIVGWINESQATNDVSLKNDKDNYDTAEYVESDERPDPAEVLEDAA